MINDNYIDFLVTLNIYFLFLKRSKLEQQFIVKPTCFGFSILFQVKFMCTNEVLLMKFIEVDLLSFMFYYHLFNYVFLCMA